MTAQFESDFLPSILRGPRSAPAVNGRIRLPTPEEFLPGTDTRRYRKAVPNEGHLYNHPAIYSDANDLTAEGLTDLAETTGDFKNANAQKPHLVSFVEERNAVVIATPRNYVSR